MALGLLERAPDARIVLAPVAVEHLVEGSRFDFRAYFGSLKERPACRELLGVLRTGVPRAWASATAAQDWESRLGDVEFARRISAAMDSLERSSARRSRRRWTSYPFALCSTSAEVEAYSCALIDHSPQLSATVFERPPVDQAARVLLAERGYADRVTVVSGDMFSDLLPRGHDLHLFSHVLHDWGDRACASCYPPRSRHSNPEAG